MTVGLFLRIPYSNSPESMGLYIIMYMVRIYFHREATGR